MILKDAKRTDHVTAGEGDLEIKRFLDIRTTSCLDAGRRGRDSKRRLNLSLTMDNSLPLTQSSNHQQRLVCGLPVLARFLNCNFVPLPILTMINDPIYPVIHPTCAIICHLRNPSHLDSVV
jgi:hypothetical protein